MDLSNEEAKPLLLQQTPSDTTEESTDDDLLKNKPNRQSKYAKYYIVISCATWGFLTGVERAIIMPTLWLFLHTKFGDEVAQNYYGTCLAAFNFSVFIVSPIYGYLAYKGFRTKFLLIVSNQMEIIGNIIYFAASEPWMILIGRFICGIGSGSEVPLYADVVRITNKKERTFYIIILLLARQIGLIIGPSFSLIFHPVKVMIGNILLNIYNSPGFLMSILWSLQTLLVVIIYPEISKDGKVIDDSQQNIRLEQKIIRKVYRSNNSINESISNDFENEFDLINEENLATSTNNSQFSIKFDKLLIKFRTISSYVTLSLLFTVFSSYFCLLALESILPPVTVRYLKWNEIENSWVYLIAGILVILTFAVLQKVSQYLKDRTILSIGLLLLIISYCWMTVTLCFINYYEKNLYIVLLCLSLLLHVIGMSLVVACEESMFTKALPNEEMDLAQSILRSTINFAILIGTFLAGLLQFYSYFVFFLMLLSVFFSLGFIMYRFSKFDL